MNHYNLERITPKNTPKNLDHSTAGRNPCLQPGTPGGSASREIYSGKQGRLPKGLIHPTEQLLAK